MLVLKKENPELYAWLARGNLLRQYDFLTHCVEIGLQQDPKAFDKYTIWTLNHIAVANIIRFGGRFRDEPVFLETHKPPHFQSVPDLMDKFFAFIHENWDTIPTTTLAAYALWRLNWIHPFVEGNGRTARATCYYILCVKSGRLLPGKKIVPDRIQENRQPYYEALRAADRAWHEGNLDVSALADYLATLVEAQINNED